MSKSALNNAAVAYRPDIQGLRGIAVLAVILAHAGIPTFSGGFVGVDVFFVLSGFLITSQLLQEHEQHGRISLPEFYLRRLRRLLPALIVVAVATAGAAFLLVSEADRRVVLKSLPFAVTWTSNFYLSMRERDYFDEVGEKDLFTHTWSLGVEEQFYLIWPAVLLALIGVARYLSLRLGLMIVVGLSFFISVAWSYWHPISAFYMMPSRIWQFGLGGLVYLYLVNPEGMGGSTPSWLCRYLVILGLALVLGAVLLLDSKIIYPGFWALLPSVGAALVIFAGSLRVDRTQSVRWLTCAPLVWLGDRSYSLYLWHYPVIVMIGLIGGDIQLGGWRPWAALSLLLILSMASYRLVELPFWKMRFKSLPPRTFALASSAAVIFVMANSFYIQNIATDTSHELIYKASAIRRDLPAIYSMGCDTWFTRADVEPCVLGPVDASKTVVLLGDSIGGQWVSVLENIFPAPEWRVVVLTKSSCPIVDEDFFYAHIGKTYDICRQWRDMALKQMADFSPNVIVVGSAATYDFSNNQWVEGSRRVLEQLSNIAERVVLVSGTPGLQFDGPSCVLRHWKAGGKLETMECSSENATGKTDRVARLLSKAASGLPNVQVINPAELVCPQGQCRAMLSSGMAVFRDSHHLTDTYVRSTSEHWRALLISH